MGTTRVFLPQNAIDAWLAAGSVQLSGDHLRTLDDDASYRLVEAIRVVGEVSGTEDRHELVGKVKPLAHVRELGAELLGESMVLDDNAYDIVLGWVLVPEGATDLDPTAEAESEARALAQFLAKNL